MSSIETGVDKLVALVKEKRKVSLDEAAKTLFVDKNTVQEWADFLEEEGVIEIKYGFAKTFLVIKTLTPAEARDQERNVERQRETYLGATDPSVARTIAEHPDEFAQFKQEFIELKRELAQTVTDLRNEIKGLHDIEHAHAKSLADLTKERELVTFDRREALREHLDVADIYWIAHYYLNSILAGAGHRSEIELGRAIAILKHDFLSNKHDLATRWESFYADLLAAQHAKTKPNAQKTHELFVRSRILIDDTVHAGVESVDDFTRRVTLITDLLKTGDLRGAHERYQSLVPEYESFPEERKALHYEKFNTTYQALMAALGKKQ